MTTPWGYHLSLDCHEARKELITDSDNIAAFVKQLVRDIDMVAYGEPQIVNFGTGDKEGYTLVQLIETSNICAHFVNETGAIYIDVFSCKQFDQDVVSNLVDAYFAPRDMTRKYFVRA